MEEDLVLNDRIKFFVGIRHVNTWIVELPVTSSSPTCQSLLRCTARLFSLSILALNYSFDPRRFSLYFWTYFLTCDIIVLYDIYYISITLNIHHVGDTSIILSIKSTFEFLSLKYLNTNIKKSNKTLKFEIRKKWV